MRIAELNERLAIEEPASVWNDSGGREVAWRLRDSVWARIEPMSGAESPVAAAMRSKLTHRIRLRYRADLGPALRFAGSGRVFDIVAVFPGTERRRWSICYCSEVVGP
jgi:SPP1 family predicted phage head-tail adaptor